MFSKFAMVPVKVCQQISVSTASAACGIQDGRACSEDPLHSTPEACMVGLEPRQRLRPCVVQDWSRAFPAGLPSTTPPHHRTATLPHTTPVGVAFMTPPLCPIRNASWPYVPCPANKSGGFSFPKHYERFRSAQLRNLSIVDCIEFGALLIGGAPRAVRSRLFFTTGSHGSQGPEFCTPDAVLNGSCTLL